MKKGYRCKMGSYSEVSHAVSVYGEGARSIRLGAVNVCVGRGINDQRRLVAF